MKVAVFGAAGWLGRAFLSNTSGQHEIRACDLGPQAWEAWTEVDGEWDEGEKVYGDIAEYEVVDQTLDGVDAVLHMILYSAGGAGQTGGADDDKPWLIYLKGLWNVLEAARQRGIKRIVHLGSCQTIHPDGIFFSADVRRPDASKYAVCKRLQEEMCRQFYDAYGLSIIVLRPDLIVDSRLGIDRDRRQLKADGVESRTGWVCRHDLAEACRLAAESQTIDFDVFHIVGTPEADKTCNVARSREMLGLQYQGDLEQYR